MRRPRREAEVLRRAKPPRDPREDAARRARLDSAPRAESRHSSAGILRLQATIGNRAVQRLIVERQPTADNPKAPASTPGAVATFTLENQGKLKGGSGLAGHEGKIELHAVQVVPTNRSASSRGKEEPEKRFIELVITKTQDGTSAAFQRAAFNGERIESAQIEFIRRGDDGTIETRMTLDFSNGFVTNYSTSSGGDEPMDSIAIQFEQPSK